MLPGISGPIQNEAKEQSGGFLSMLLGILEAILLGNILTSKERSWRKKRVGQGILRAGYGSNSRSKKIKFSFPSSSIEKYWNKKVLSKWTYVY